MSSETDQNKDEFMRKIRSNTNEGMGNMEAKFINACKSGNLKIVDEMLSMKRRCFDINFRDQRGQTALHYSILNEQEDVFERLLSEHEVVLNDALHCAVETMNITAAQKLLNTGADPNQVLVFLPFLVKNNWPAGTTLRAYFENAEEIDTKGILLCGGELDLSNQKPVMIYGLKLENCPEWSELRNIPKYGRQVYAELYIGWKPLKESYLRSGDFFTKSPPSWIKAQRLFLLN